MGEPSTKRNISIEYINLSYARVLIVDDMLTNLQVLKSYLKPYRLQIELATRGTQAVELIRAGTPYYSAIFLDYLMPGIDGVEATRMIREDIGTEYAKNIPIIAFTASNTEFSSEMFIQNGFQAHLPKPVDLLLLDRILKRWVMDSNFPSGNNRRPECYDCDRLNCFSTCSEISSDDNDIILDESSPLKDLHIIGIDIKRGLKNFSDSESYISILNSYLENSRPLINKMNVYLAVNNLENYIVTIHGIKSSSYGICADEIGALAERLEHTAKGRNLDAIRTEHFIFEKKIKSLLDNLDRSLQAMNSHDNKPQTDSPDRELLIRLMQASKDYNMDLIDKIMMQLNSFSYKKEGKIVIWLREQVKNMNLDAIARGLWPKE